VFVVKYEYHLHTKMKMCPFNGPWRFRFPYFLDNRLNDGGEVVSLTRRSRFTPQDDSWYSFLLEAE
jgi:hypothetical protein